MTGPGSKDPAKIRFFIMILIKKQNTLRIHGIHGINRFRICIDKQIVKFRNSFLDIVMNPTLCFTSYPVFAPNLQLQEIVM